ncbi:MAG: tetratricopeptide repeat protein [Deltaproteobacteria bacterium]|nr:tetratricopeptide repeat protein [Deltaproteobacteria bacterium]
MIFSGWLLQSRLKKALDQLNCGMFETASQELRLLLREFAKEEREVREVLFYLAECLMAMGDEKLEKEDFAGALRDFEEAVALQVEFPDLYYRIGRCCLALGSEDRAEKNFQKALSMNEHYRNARLALAEVHIRKQKFDLAFQAYERVYEQGMEPDEASFTEVRRMAESGNVQKAVDLLREIFREKPDRVKALFQQGKRHFHEQDYAGAIASFRELISGHADFPDVYNFLGVACCGAGDFNEGEKAFLQSMELNPAYMDPRLNLAFLYEKMNKKEKAGEVLEGVLSVDPGNVIAKEGLKKLQK